MKIRVLFWLTVFHFISSSPMFAQRENFSFRTEWMAPTAISVDDFRGFNSGEVTGYSSVLAWADRSVLNKKGSSVLTSTVSYRFTNLQYNIEPNLMRLPGPISPSDLMAFQLNNGITLHQFQADLLLMTVINPKWILYGLARPAMMSDLDGTLGFRDFRLEAAVFGEYRMSSKLRIGPGLSRSSAFGRVLWIPLMRVLYRPAPKVLVDGLLPSRLDVWYLPSKKWEYGFGLALNGGQFRMNDNSGLGGNQFGFANGLALLQVKHLVSGKWYAQVDAGVSIVPRQELTNYDYRLFPSRTILVDLNPNPIPVVRFGVFKVF